MREKKTNGYPPEDAARSGKIPERIHKPVREAAQTLALGPYAIGKYFADQASMILNSVGEKLSAQERRFNIRLEKMEERFAKRLDELTKTLDKFLKRVSDIEEEFTFMKADLNRVKAVLREKLGVVLD